MCDNNRQIEIEKAIEKLRVASWRYGHEEHYGRNLQFENRRKVNVAYHELVELIKSIFAINTNIKLRKIEKLIESYKVDVKDLKNRRKPQGSYAWIDGRRTNKLEDVIEELETILKGG